MKFFGEFYSVREQQAIVLDELAERGIVYRLQQLPLVFSLEYVRRFGDDGDDRFVGVADYRINNIYSVFLSYGKDFETDFNGNEDLVTLFGLKVGLGKNPQTIETISQEQQ